VAQAGLDVFAGRGRRILVERICPRCEDAPVYAHRAGYCRPCNNEIGRENYRRNKERYFKLARKRGRGLDNLINSRKGVPCSDCGIQYPPYVMEFDHIPEKGKKLYPISTMRRRKMAFSKILLEIEKCEVVCSNCHRERTNSRQPARYSGDF